MNKFLIFLFLAINLSLFQNAESTPAIMKEEEWNWDETYLEEVEEEAENYNDRMMHYHPGMVRNGPPNPDETKETWIKDGQDTLRAKLGESRILNKAKNIIFFLGDGMGVTVLTGARIYKGQEVTKSDRGGEEDFHHMETFPYVGSSKTFCADGQVADSACSATAYLCGTKANDGTIGLSPAARYKNCSSQNEENKVRSILEWAQDAGMWTGIVTTTRITHASPAGTYAKIANRDWENNAWIERDDPENHTKCKDIAAQLVEDAPGKNIRVILGGGRREFWDIDGERDWEYAQENNTRTDGKNLTADWERMKEDMGVNYKFIQTEDELNEVNTNEIEYLLGLFGHRHLEYNDTRERYQDPSIEKMTQVAIDILSKSPNGYFLFVEGGRIDHALHDNYARRSFVELIEFDKAIKKADEMTNDQDTLLLVTADHSHVPTISGYPTRGNKILGVNNNNFGSDILPNLPTATFSYANGKGYRNHTVLEMANGNFTCVRVNVSEIENKEQYTDRLEEMYSYTFHHPAMVPKGSETHGGEDVFVFAKGPFAHLFTGVFQQSYIPHALGYAASIGPYHKFTSSAFALNQNLSLIILSLVILLFKFHSNR